MYEFLTELMLRVVYKIPNSYDLVEVNHPKLGTWFNCFDHEICIRPNGDCVEVTWEYDYWDGYSSLVERPWPN